MSTINLATLQSNTALPPTIQNSSAVEIGTFCRAWVNFNGTGTVAIRASFNVTSITDNGTGDYTVNFTTALVDANYCYTMAVEDASIALLNTNFTSFSKTTSSIRTGTRYISSLSGSATADDADSVCVAIFR